MRGVSKNPDNGTGFVNEQIGEAYRIVSEVRDKLAEITTVAEAIDVLNDMGGILQSVNLALSASSNATAMRDLAAGSATNSSNWASQADISRVSALNSKNDAASSAATALAEQLAATAAKVAAQAALDATLATYDSFDDRYLGPKAQPLPTADNDGQPLLDGALCFDTTAKVMKLWNLSTLQWEAAYVGSAGLVAKSGDTMTGPLVLPGDPTVANHAARKAYVDGLTTAAAILAKIITVDGAGSGLDADLLDGLNSTDFVRRAGDTMTGQLSLVGDPVGASDAARKAYVDGLTTAASLFAKILTVDGSGSGLDADLLDGLDSSAFVLTNGFRTMTGSLKVAIATQAVFHPGGGNFRSVIHRNDGTDYYILISDPSTSPSEVWNALRPLQINLATGTLLVNGQTNWHAGNDGAGSGLDADLLDGINSDGFIRKTGDLVQGGIAFQNPDSSSIASRPSANTPLIAMNNGTGPAIMTFHRTGSFAAFLGVDNDNVLKYGGWSLGAVAYPVWHAGSDGSGSGLDADLLDGLDSSAFARRSGDTISGNFAVTGTFFPGNDGQHAQYISGGNPIYNWDSGDYSYYDRAGNSYQFVIGNVGRFSITDSNAYVLGNVVWNSANDGSGSGLDADLLDGLQSTQFLRRDANQTVSGFALASDSSSNDSFGGLELREANYIGLGSGAATFAPGINFHWVSRSAARIYMNSGGQFVFAGQNDITNNRRDILGANIFSNGALCWSSGNDGSGSGLDADLLDGLHSGDFVWRMIGNQQTWENMVGSRFSNTSYQNTTGRPIMVAVVHDNAAAGFEVSSDNVSWIRLVNGSNYANMSAIIPPNHYYRVAGVANIFYWGELR